MTVEEEEEEEKINIKITAVKEDMLLYNLDDTGITG